MYRGKKDDPDLLERQFRNYQETGLPEDVPVIAGKVIIRRHNRPHIKKAMQGPEDRCRARSPGAASRVALHIASSPSSEGHFFVGKVPQV